MARKASKHGPMYLQLAEILQGEIKAGRYAVGEFLPSERELARLYEVTRITVRGALKELAKQGLLAGEPHRCRRIVAAPDEMGNLELLFFKWISPFADPILANFCTGVVTEAGQRNYQLVLSYISDEDSIARHLERLERPVVKGIIAIGSYEWYGPVMGRIESRYPTVLVGTPHGALRADVIGPDFEGAMAMAVSHLKGLGHERVLLLAGAFPTDEGRDQRNIESFRQTATQIGYDPSQIQVFDGRAESDRALGPGDSAGFWIAENVFERCPPPLAVVATAPSYVRSLLALAEKKGLRVPEDVAVIATQDSRQLVGSPMPVTAVDIYGRSVGMHAVQLLDERLSNPALPRRMERAEIALTVRGSCGETDVPSPAQVSGAPELTQQEQR